MRRKDREISKEDALLIIDQAQYGILAACDPNSEEPLALPLSLARKGNKLFFHSAKEGRKVGVLEDGKKVSLVFTGLAQVPDSYSTDRIDKIIASEANPIGFLASNVFTTAFESTIVTGIIRQLEEKEAKLAALELIAKKYTPDKMQYFKMAAEGSLHRVNLYQIEIITVRGKRKKIV